MSENIVNVIWIDQNYNNEENKLYLKELEAYNYLDVKCFINVDEAIKYIRKIEFKETNIITSGKLYINFIEKFKENIKNIYVIPKIIIFTKNKDEFLKYNDEHKKYIDDPFYNLGETRIYWKDIKDFILQPLHKKIINNPKNGETNLKKDDKLINLINKYNQENNLNLTFEYIDCKEKLYYPILYKSLIEINKNDKIDLFTESLYNKYSKCDKEIEYLLNTIKNMINIPIELLSKYYVRLYTIDSIFYRDLNKDLRESKTISFLLYIKVLYEALKLQSLSLASDQILYRGGILSNKEIDKIKKYLYDKKEGLPGAIVFSRTFLSFTKKKEIAETYLEIPLNNPDLNKIIFILEKDNCMDYSLSTHADIQNISYYPSEKEVLFFPFSSFEIKEINEIIINNEKGFEIKLLYLGKYLKELENNIKHDNKIPNSEFKKELLELGLIENSKNKDTPKYLLEKYKKHKVEINKKNNNKVHNKEDKTKNNKINSIEENNYIIGELETQNFYKVNSKVRIINSYEQCDREDEWPEFKDENKNEKEIKNNVEIIINGKKIEFSYFYNLKYKFKTGKNKIKYIFKKNMSNTCCLFYGCESLVNIDLSNFNTKDITNMENMFSGCTFLKKINFLNFNTQNVVNMNNMFSGCELLKSIDLSNFDTRNVTNMSGMFSQCNSLKNLDLSKFNTQNVIDMSWMFCNCESLKNIDLSNFDTLKVKDMKIMFSECKTLKSLDLSKFDTQNVVNMNLMFSECKDLKNLDLSNFNTQKVIDMKDMFFGCSSLTSKNIITKDDKIKKIIEDL